MLKKLAQHHSATSFLNSFLLEWQEVHFENGAFHIPLENEVLMIPVKQFSLVGRHHYEGRFFSKTNSQNQEEIEFEVLAKKLIYFLSKHFKTPRESAETFLSRVINSVLTVESILKIREQELRKLGPDDINFSTTEQALFIGHNFHPTPKARSEFSHEDAKNFSPELKGKLSLHWYLVREEILFHKISSRFDNKSWAEELFLKEFPGAVLEKGFTPFPVHPWQRNILLENHSFRHYLEHGQIIDQGSSQTQWLPTSSVRTLFHSEAPFMLKFSLSVKLTNSKRDLLTHELDRGLILHEKIQAVPELELIHEPFFAGLLDLSGEIITESLLLGRVNPFQDETGVSLVAALTMDHIDFGEGLIHQCIRARAQENGLGLKETSLEWFRAFFNTAIAPLIKAASNQGILLGSHQQNMLLKLENKLPVKSYFRDCNGTGFTIKGQKRYDAQGIILDEKPAAYLFGYYVIINTAFNVLSSIARSGYCTEEELLRAFRDYLRELRPSLSETFIVDYLLNHENLMHKGNFLCSFKNINENTESDPLSIYTPIRNPLILRKDL